MQRVSEKPVLTELSNGQKLKVTTQKGHEDSSAHGLI